MTRSPAVYACCKDLGADARRYRGMHSSDNIMLNVLLATAVLGTGVASATDNLTPVAMASYAGPEDQDDGGVSDQSDDDGGASDHSPDIGAERPVESAPPEDTVDLGGDDAQERRCPELAVSPEAFYDDYMSALNKVSGVDRIPYHSCKAECHADAAVKGGRMWRIALLVGNTHAGPLHYGKAGPAAFHALADRLVEKGAQSDWSSYAGIDCNGFTHQFAAQNGWSWAHAKLDPPLYASQPHVQTTRDICPGDFIVYTGGRHVALVGERVGQDVIVGPGGKQVQLATFKVYESASDGTWKGLQTSVQGIDLTGRDRFVLYHHRPLGVGRSRDNNVVVVPGPGSL